MLQYSPKIIQDGLVMCLDASQNKSYPTTDLPVKDGLILWLDASDDTTFSYSSGTLVSQWRDKSGLNNHANQSTAANQSSRNSNTNSRKTVSFDGTNDYLDGTNILTLANGYTLFTIIKSSATGERDIITSTPFAGSTDIYLYQQGSSGKFGNWPTVFTSNAISLNTWYSLSTTVSSAGSETLYLNGSSQTSSSRTVTNTKGYKIGSNSSAGEYWNGEIAEIIIFNKQLTTTERKQVHSYLGQKWGILNSDRSIIDLAGNDDNGLLGDGTTTNMPAFDYYNKGGFKFDGTNDYIKVGTNTSLQVNNVTIGAFFKTINNSQSTQFITGYGDTGIAGYWLGMSGGPILFSIGGGSGNYRQLNSTVTPNNDQIYYVIGTYDGTNQKVYINGSLQASATTVSGNISYSGLTDGFLLGQIQGFTSTRYLTGSIYNIHIYNRALTATEISQNYEALKLKFTNTIVQQGLVLNLDAGNAYSYAGAGTTWYDVSGNSYNGTLTGGPTYSSDNGGVISFDGVDDYSVSSVSSITDSSTVGLWIKSSSYNNKIPISIDGTNYGSGPNLYFISNAIMWNIGDSASNPFSNSSYPDSNWHYIVVTNDSSSNAKLYIDGVLIGTATYRSTLSSGSNNFWIGRFHGDNNYTISARIGGVQLYNRVLTAAQVLQNYNATKDRFGL